MSINYFAQYDELTVIAQDSDGSWQGVPSAYFEDDEVMVADLRRLGRLNFGKLKSSEGACCYSGLCELVSKKECVGVFVGTGVPCDTGGASACDSLVCCMESGVASRMITGQCLHLGGEEVDTTECQAD